MNRRIWMVGGSAGTVLMLMIVSVNTAIASNANNQQFDEKNVVDQYMKKSSVYQKFFHDNSSLSLKIDIFKILQFFTAIFNFFIRLFVWFSMTFLR
ncbi:MAG: hypothetical protein V1726_04015 [Methanobacteriota archaeon]